MYTLHFHFYFIPNQETYEKEKGSLHYDALRNGRSARDGLLDGGRAGVCPARTQPAGPYFDGLRAGREPGQPGARLPRHPLRRASAAFRRRAVGQRLVGRLQRLGLPQALRAVGHGRSRRLPLPQRVHPAQRQLQRQAACHGVDPRRSLLDGPVRPVRGQVPCRQRRRHPRHHPGI